MQFLTLSRRRSDQFSDEQFRALVDAEVRQACVLYGEGFLRQIWHKADNTGACILVEAASEAEVREQLDTLPMVAAGMLETTIIPLKPYAGFAVRNIV